jgi:hypothetical protein
MLLVAILAGGVIFGIAVSCGEDFEDCYGSDYLGCACPDGGWGYAKCSPLGDFVTATCVCDGTTPGVDAGEVDAGEPDAAEGTDAGGCTVDAGDAGYFGLCASNTDCASCVCASFGDAGRCTRRCISLVDCPAPADACTSRGVCRPGPGT